MVLADRANQSLILKGGRRLGFAEFGAQAGTPVLHFHGSASSRLERPPLDTTLSQLDIRFISVDRPGHGLSDFSPNRRLLDWPQDVCQLADHLGIHRFYVEGYSAGGPHALACAHQLPDRVRAGALIASVAPMSRRGAYEGLPLSNRILARSARWFPGLVRLIRWAMRRLVMGDAEKSARRLMSSIPDADKAVLYTPPNVDLFVRSVREGFRPGSRGVATDDILVNREWGFDLGDIQPRIDIWQGDADVNVPVHAARYLNEAIPHPRLTILPGQGHFFVFERWHEVLTALLSETEPGKSARYSEGAGSQDLP
jgi:pimeloyl-ACP methyl ester carboxylesterase